MRARDPGQAAPRRSVLLVEDDPEVCELVRIALVQSGYEVHTASNGRDALYCLRSMSSPALIILDLMLPKMDGEAFRAAQLRDRSLAWIPVVVLSGAIGGDQKARELQAAAFVQKPFDIDELRHTISAISATSPRVRPSLRRAEDIG